MSKRVRKFAPTLTCLGKCDKHTAKSIIKNAQPELLGCISEICHNVLRGNVELSPIDRRKLAKYKTHIRRIADKKTTNKTRKTLIQKGGFLSALIAPLLGSIIAPLASSLIPKR